MGRFTILNNMKKLYKNWFVHNVFGHSTSEMLYWFLKPFGEIRASRVSIWFHDVTCPSTLHKDKVDPSLRRDLE